MSRTKQTGISVATFAARWRQTLEHEVERMLSASAVDEANGEVFDDLIESWRVQEQAGLEATAGSASTGLTLERQRVREQLEALDAQAAEATRDADALRAELQAARLHLRGAS